MRIDTLLSTIILVSFLVTILMAVGSYAAYKLREARRPHAEPRAVERRVAVFRAHPRRRGVMRIGPALLVFGAPALAVVLVSAAVTLRRTEAATRPQPARFSGSTVVQRLPSLLASPRLADEIPVVVVRDDAAASFYTSPAELDAIIARWRDALAAIGADVRVLSPTAARDDRTARVFVVPSSPCLTVATRELLDAAATRGAGVILTGAAGIYDAGCRPLGYGLIIGATGAARADVLDQREMTYVTFPSTSALSADIPPGARLDLNPGRQIALRHRTRDAFYSDYSLQPEPAHREPLLDAALTHANHRWAPRRLLGIRAVGCRRASVGSSDRAAARAQLRRVGGAGAARDGRAVAAGQTRRRVDRAGCRERVRQRALRRRLAPRCRRALDVLSHLAARRSDTSVCRTGSPSPTKSARTARTIGCSVACRAREQRVQLDDDAARAATVVGSDVNGLRPPEEQFDTATMSAWLAAKGNYLFGANDSRSAAPELLRVGSDTLVLVGRVGSDDFAAVARRHRRPDTLAAIFLGEFERVRALGGHYVLSYHSQVLGATRARAVAGRGRAPARGRFRRVGRGGRRRRRLVARACAGHGARSDRREVECR